MQTIQPFFAGCVVDLPIDQRLSICRTELKKDPSLVPQFPLKRQVLSSLAIAIFDTLDKGAEAQLSQPQCEVRMPALQEIERQEAKETAKNMPSVIFGMKYYTRIHRLLAKADNELTITERLTQIAKQTIPEMRAAIESKRDTLKECLPIVSTLEAMVPPLIEEAKTVLARKVLRDAAFCSLKEKVFSVVEKNILANVEAWASLPKRPEPPQDGSSATCCPCDCNCDCACPRMVVLTQIGHFESAANEQELLEKISHVKTKTLPALLKRFSDCEGAEPLKASLQASSEVITSLFEQVSDYIVRVRRNYPDLYEDESSLEVHEEATPANEPKDKERVEETQAQAEHQAETSHEV